MGVMLPTHCRMIRGLIRGNARDSRHPGNKFLWAPCSALCSWILPPHTSSAHCGAGLYWMTWVCGQLDSCVLGQLVGTISRTEWHTACSDGKSWYWSCQMLHCCKYDIHSPLFCLSFLLTVATDSELSVCALLYPVTIATDSPDSSPIPIMCMFFLTEYSVCFFSSLSLCVCVFLYCYCYVVWTTIRS